MPDLLVWNNRCAFVQIIIGRSSLQWCAIIQKKITIGIAFTFDQTGILVKMAEKQVAEPPAFIDAHVTSVVFFIEARIQNQSIEFVFVITCTLVSAVCVPVETMSVACDICVDSKKIIVGLKISEHVSL